MSHPDIAKEIIQAWIKKGGGESDTFSRFIYFWIAFNCWYITTFNTDSDRAAIERMKKDIKFQDTFSKLYSQDRSPFDKLSGRIVHNVRLPERTSNVRAGTDYAGIIEYLYIVRNNLFHGSKRDIDSDDREIISSAVPALEALVKEFTKHRNF